MISSLPFLSLACYFCYVQHRYDVRLALSASLETSSFELSSLLPSSLLHFFSLSSYKTSFGFFALALEAGEALAPRSDFLSSAPLGSPASGSCWQPPQALAQALALALALALFLMLWWLSSLALALPQPLASCSGSASCLSLCLWLLSCQLVREASWPSPRAGCSSSKQSAGAAPQGLWRSKTEVHHEKTASSLELHPKVRRPPLMRLRFKILWLLCGSTWILFDKCQRSRADKHEARWDAFVRSPDLFVYSRNALVQPSGLRRDLCIRFACFSLVRHLRLLMVFSCLPLLGSRCSQSEHRDQSQLID